MKDVFEDAFVGNIHDSFEFIWTYIDSYLFSFIANLKH